MRVHSRWLVTHASLFTRLHLIGRKPFGDVSRSGERVVQAFIAKMPWRHLLLLLLLQVTLLWLNNAHAGGSTMECYTQGGPPYNGTLNKTAAGEPCLPWSDFTHLRLRSNWNASVLLEHANYCRNPDDDPRGPWCMVTKAKYGTCAIPHCGKCLACIHPTGFFEPQWPCFFKRIRFKVFAFYCLWIGILNAWMTITIL